MKYHDFLKKTGAHHGVVIDISKSGFDQGVASFGSVFVDADDPQTLLLYYAGGQDDRMIHSAIGLAMSKDGLRFRKMGQDPLFEPRPGSFCYTQATTPAVTKIHNRYYMFLSGKPSVDSPRRIGYACADDPRGPWSVIGELIRPAHLWEGNGIDNGPSIVRLDADTVLLYYSSITTPRGYDLFSVLRRYPIRRIGILKLHVHGASSSSIQAMRFSGNPLKHLNGPKGSWHESVFCPGHIALSRRHVLFPAASTYSARGFPYKQYIGMTTSATPYFGKNASDITKLIDGPSEKSEIVLGIRSEIALDTPAPYFDAQKRKLFLYYSVADRADEVWKIALTTFDFAR